MPMAVSGLAALIKGLDVRATGSSSARAGVASALPDDAGAPLGLDDDSAAAEAAADEADLAAFNQLNPQKDGAAGSLSSLVGVYQDVANSPVFSWRVKSFIKKQGASAVGGPDLNAILPQYGLLGFQTTATAMATATATTTTTTPPTTPSRPGPAAAEPIFLNTNAPWSAFICGSQGSGKSHTLSCMLENCLFPSKRTGRLQRPLTGVVFHYESHASAGVCEAAYLCSLGIKVQVLVPSSSLDRLRRVYGQVAGSAETITVKPLRFKPKHLNIERMKTLMAFSDTDSVPLYMEILIKTLRDMAGTDSSKVIDFPRFEQTLSAEGFTKDQRGPLALRLQLLKSFLDLNAKTASRDNIFNPDPGSLTIVDLTDPFMDGSSACTFFDICLALFLENGGDGGRVFALDEAHKYMSESGAARSFTESLLSLIRQQRHKASRVIIATQEPTIAPQLLDLCSVTIVHRFSSASWLKTLSGHIAGLALPPAAPDSAAAATAAAASRTDALSAMFGEIVRLSTGQGLLFGPTAALALAPADGGDGRQLQPAMLGLGCCRFRTRLRLSSDGGRSKMAVVDE